MNRKRENKRTIGAAYERIAGEYLKAQGYAIIQYNYRCRAGEIDMIARDGEYLVFCEVKYRSGGESGHPLEAVDSKKQRVLSKCALYYLAENGYHDIPCRFDVVGIFGDKILVVKDGFDFR